MKYIIAFALSFSLSFLYAAEERDLICQTGPGMHGTYGQTPRHQKMTIYFKRQNISHANKKVEPGYCTFALAGMGNEWSDKLFINVDNNRDTLLSLHISPTTMSLNEQAMAGANTIDPRIKEMFKMLHQPNRRYIIRAVHKKMFGQWVWEVKSIGWNNTL